MSASFIHRLAVWGVNALNMFMGGAAGGVLTALGVSATNMLSPGLIKELSWHQFLVVCLVSGAISLAQFIRTPAGRIPSLDTDSGGITPLPTNIFPPAA